MKGTVFGAIEASGQLEGKQGRINNSHHMYRLSLESGSSMQTCYNTGVRTSGSYMADLAVREGCSTPPAVVQVSHVKRRQEQQRQCTGELQHAALPFFSHSDRCRLGCALHDCSRGWEGMQPKDP